MSVLKMMMIFRRYLTFLLLVTLSTVSRTDSNVPCPNRCLCFATTVRCMFLQLDHIPKVQPETTTLDLRFNRIKEIPPNSFKNLPKLTTLLLNNNFITRIPDGIFNGLPNLRYLYLYKNHIKVIDSNGFQGLNHLEQLYLHFNQIDNLKPETFSTMPSLERLFLHNNKLAHLPIEAFQNVTKLKRLRLDSNSLVCDCQILWLTKMLKETHGKTVAAAICEHPASMQGKSLSTLEESAFQCMKPVLMEEPNDVDLKFGSTLSLKCKADGDPRPEIFWLHNENELDMSDAEDNRYRILDDGTLMIDNAQESDQGYYECMAKNSMGEIKSRKAKMRRHAADDDDRNSLPSLVSFANAPENLVNDVQHVTTRHTHGDRVSKRPKFILTPADQLVIRGNVVNLQCQAIGDPEPSISWTKDDQVISDSQRIQTSSYGVLTIDDANTKDSGTYRCIASNSLGKVSASAKVTVQAPPVFFEVPRDQILEAGEDALFTCRASGDPAPNIVWVRKGQILKTNNRMSISDDGTNVVIRNVDKSDQTTYLCRAQNPAGTNDAGADLIIRDPSSPAFSSRPRDLQVSKGDTVEMPCSAIGDPQPTIEWRKDGVTLFVGGRHRIISDGNLIISEVVSDDQGLYECRAENDVGYDSTTAFLTVSRKTSRRISDNDVRQSVDEATHLIDKAINDTLKQLFEKKVHRTPSDLLRSVRFPTPQVQAIVRSAEIYEHAITSVRHFVDTGTEFNLTNEFSHPDLLSTENLQLMANLSGCLIHRKVPHCSDMCFHSKFRSYNGSCNNFQNPLWGASEVALRRLLSPIYENGFNTPIGWNEGRTYHGFKKPSARLISTSVIRTQSITPDETFTHMLMQWGQFLDHDLDLAPPTVSTESFLDGANCRETCDNALPCFPIPIPDGDNRIRTLQCMEFVRSSAVCGSGVTSVLYGTVMRREQLNVLTSYIDASQVYGSSEAEADHLRQKGDEANGLLRSGIITEAGKPLLPFSDTWPTDCRRDTRESDVGCFVAGDMRVNEQLALTAMHTIWFREHNRLASRLHELNRHWDNERLYQESRKIVGAQMQHITYEHWLPKVLGPKGIEMLGPYEGYDPSVDATISNEFATAALRFGHTLINPVLHRLDATFRPIPQGHVHLRNAFFSPFRILEEGGIDPLLRGLFAIPTKLKRPSEMLNSELTEQLFRQVNQVALDLAAINIQRARDHGIPSYNEYRRFCNLSLAETFHDLRHEISDKELRDKLENVYGHPGNIDLWVGGVTEDVVEGAKVGPTFLCILVDQFKRLRSGDRLYYKNPGVFSPDQLTQLKQTTLARILCDNGDAINEVSLDVFTVPEKQGSKYVSCETIPREDFRPWVECCHGCNGPTTPSRKRRQIDNYYSYTQDRPSTNKTNAETENRVPQSIPTEIDVNEDRFEGIEDIVDRLQKTVRRLTKKVHFLEKKCNGMSISDCRDENGAVRTNGERWTKDKCSECDCQNSQVTCKLDSNCELTINEES